MRKKKKKIYKKKGNVIKDLTRKILKVFSSNLSKELNYKQVASAINLDTPNARDQVIKKLEALKGQGKLTETTRGKYSLNAEKNYHIGTLDLTSNGNAYFICDDFEHFRKSCRGFLTRYLSCLRPESFQIHMFEVFDRNQEDAR